MAFFRQIVAPLFIVLIFLVALLATSARIFLPSDMLSPAPVEQVVPVGGRAQLETQGAMADLPPSLQVLVKGLPADTDAALFGNS